MGERTLPSRRAFVSALGAAGLAGCLPRAARRAPPRRAASRGAPRNLVQIFLPGGIDEMLGFNPKATGEARRGIAPTYSPAELLTAGGRAFGPSLRPLARFLPRMQVIRGVQSSTVAHEVGTIQNQQLRRNFVSPRDELIMTRIGGLLAPEAPLHCLQLGRGDATMWTPTEGRCLTDDSTGRLLAALHAIAQSDARREASLAALAAAAPRGRSAGRDPFELARFVIERLRGTRLPSPRFVADPSELPGNVPIAERAAFEREIAMPFEWALFALEHDLAPSVYLTCDYNWDTHQDNDNQAIITRHFAGLLDHFLTRLEAIRRDGRPLADQVGIVITSELGRFPYVNARHGKDHLPQIAVVLMGPGLRADTFGETDDELVGAPVEIATGRPGPRGVHLTLDDVGRTLLEWVGCADPEGLGYLGRVLEFCFT
jgi:hypothetical protein